MICGKKDPIKEIQKHYNIMWRIGSKSEQEYAITWGTIERHADNGINFLSH